MRRVTVFSTNQTLQARVAATGRRGICACGERGNKRVKAKGKALTSGRGKCSVHWE